MTVLVLLLLSPPALGSELDRAVGLEELNGAAEEYIDGYLTPQELAGDFSSGVSLILGRGSRALPGLLRQGIRSGILLLAVAMLWSLTDTLRQELGGDGLDPVRLAGAAAIAALAAADVNALMGLGGQTLERLDDFSKLLLPVVTAAGAAAGMPAAAVARQGTALLFLNLLLTLSRGLVLPLVYAYVAAVTAQTALGNEGLKRVAGLLKWVATSLLTVLLTVFVFFLTITGAVAGSADAVTQKAAKTALSGMVPVVGGILSDAAETVVAGAGVLKGTVGVVGLLTVLCICLAPFLRLGVHYLVYKCAAALAATAAPGPAAGLIDAIGSAFALLLGMVGGGGLILYVALITSIQAVAP